MINKFDFKDIVLVPETLTDIDSRRDVDTFNNEHFLPIMVSPMDTVVSLENSKVFSNCGMVTCFPRGIDSNIYNPGNFISMSLDDFENFIDDYILEYHMKDLNILIDIANGHMRRLYYVVEKFMSIKKNWLNHKLMVGNIANPETYRQYAELGVDFIRVGIGGGSGCLTSANTGIHYPMASLIHECYEIKKTGGYKSKIVADGGFRNYSDIIKGIAFGAEVMLGGVLNKTIE